MWILYVYPVSEQQTFAVSIALLKDLWKKCTRHCNPDFIHGLVNTKYEDFVTEISKQEDCNTTEIGAAQLYKLNIRIIYWSTAENH